ncbi:MAG: PilZ domain-containing protein [Pelomonas sp.]|nr:PilZ domain-containing protein [Roseateles sp.]
MTTPDQRRFPRVEFFLVPDANEQLPVWVIKPESETVGRAGVVVNLSGGGLQIAVSAQEPLQAHHYELRLLLGEDEGVPLFCADVRRVWSRPLNCSAQLGGFEFESNSSDAEQFLLVQTAHVAARRWVHCVLVERMTALA